MSKRETILRTLAKGVTTESLEAVANHFPHLIEEAEREMRHEVEYVMVENGAAEREQQLDDAITRVLNLTKHPLFHEQTDLKAWARAINDLRVFSGKE